MWLVTSSDDVQGHALADGEGIDEKDPQLPLAEVSIEQVQLSGRDHRQEEKRNHLGREDIELVMSLVAFEDEERSQPSAYRDCRAKISNLLGMQGRDSDQKRCRPDRSRL